MGAKNPSKGTDGTDTTVSEVTGLMSPRGEERDSPAVTMMLLAQTPMADPFPRSRVAR